MNILWRHWDTESLWDIESFYFHHWEGMNNPNREQRVCEEELANHRTQDNKLIQKQDLNKCSLLNSYADNAGWQTA